MLVSVSTMPAGNNLKQYLQQIKQFADFLHCDVCDGKYNSTVCFSPKMAQQVNQTTTLPLDVHLMTNNVLKHAKQYIEAGANIVTAQIEAFNKKTDVNKFLQLVKQNKTLAGLSIEPQTQIDAIMPFLPSLDIVLVMAVKTGSSGQKFDASVIGKIQQLNQLKLQHGYNFKIQVDGGINNTTINQIKNLGVDIVVSGGYVFNSQNKQQAIDSLR